MSRILDELRHDYRQSLATGFRLRERIASKDYFGSTKQLEIKLNINIRECKRIDKQIESLFNKKSPHLPDYAKNYWNIQKDFQKIKEIINKK